MAAQYIMISVFRVLVQLYKSVYWYCYFEYYGVYMLCPNTGYRSSKLLKK